MCSNESPPPSKEPLGMTIGNPMAGFFPGLEHYRQFYYSAMAERLRLVQQLHPQHHGVGGHGQTGQGSLAMSPGFPAPLPLYPAAAAAAAAAAGYPRGLALSMAFLHPHHQRIPEEPKPQHSYIGLIAMAILSSPEKKLVLSDIYQHILQNYPYFRSRGPGWRNSIRHNLSLNDCFVKSGRSANGKGHYWAIHPANLEDFRRGDFRRRKAQRKVRRHMGLAVDEEPDSPSPPPLPATPPPPSALVGPPVGPRSLAAIWSPHHHHHHHQMSQLQHHQTPQQLSPEIASQNSHQTQNLSIKSSLQPSRKRQFDVASLLAPDDHTDETFLGVSKARQFSCSEDEHDTDQIDQEEEDVDVDVVADANQMSSSIPTPSASPDNKIVSSGSSLCDWNTPTALRATAQQLSAIHLHNHLHVRNYYIQANATSSSSV
uniref:Fork-head domain-containing protein n=1 Tax=Bracon brevicornis TaxID=1563983 RepID=A0A6V7KMQ6_9HYME